MENLKFSKGDVVICCNDQLLKGNTHKPKVILDEEYTIKEIIEDSAGNQHLDIGLPSRLNFVTSYETKEELPRGEKIHWCHPSRFVLK